MRYLVQPSITLQQEPRTRLDCSINLSNDKGQNGHSLEAVYQKGSGFSRYGGSSAHRKCSYKVSRTFSICKTTGYRIVLFSAIWGNSPICSFFTLECDKLHQ